MATFKCEKCGNDGTEASLYLTIDAKWNGENWTLEEREDAGGGELDCLVCDHRTEAPEGCFPYEMKLGIGHLAAFTKKPALLALAERIAVFTSYGHGPDELSDSDDAALVLNALIAEARAILA